MNAIAALAKAAWKFHPNNPNRTRCPKCAGNVFPASGVLGGEIGTLTASGVLHVSNVSGFATGMLKCQKCGHAFTEPGEA